VEDSFVGKEVRWVVIGSWAAIVIDLWRFEHIICDHRHVVEDSFVGMRGVMDKADRIFIPTYVGKQHKGRPGAAKIDFTVFSILAAHVISNIE
jgi:hypothetical protein